MPSQVCRRKCSVTELAVNFFERILPEVLSIAGDMYLHDGVLVTERPRERKSFIPLAIAGLSSLANGLMNYSPPQKNHAVCEPDEHQQCPPFGIHPGRERLPSFFPDGVDEAHGNKCRDRHQAENIELSHKLILDPIAILMVADDLEKNKAKFEADDPNYQLIDLDEACTDGIMPIPYAASP